MKARMSLIAISVQAVLLLGACQSLQSDRRTMKLVPTQQVRHGMPQPDGLYAVGRYHQKQLRYDNAIDVYRRLLADYPDHAEARNALGIILVNQGKLDDAINEFELSVAYAPESASFRNNLGYTYLLLGSARESVSVLQAAAKLDPANQRVRENLTAALALSGKERAEEDSKVAGVETPVGITTTEPALTKKISAKVTDKTQLVEISNNVFALQLPTSSSAKTAPAARQPGTQNSEQVRIVQTAGIDDPARNMSSKVKVRLEVSNGNGISGLAKKTSGYLEGSGYAKARVTNELPYRLQTTEIKYRPGFEPQARSLQATFRGGIPLNATQYLRADVNVRLVLGKDVKSVTELLAHVPTEPASFQLARAIQ